MVLRTNTLETRLGALDRELASARPRINAKVGLAVDRWRADAGAARFHLAPGEHHPLLLAVVGGTGTGKSTLVNRLLDADLSATSFRRTFTSGAVAIAHETKAVPQPWLGVPHRPIPTSDLPARGQIDALMVVAEPTDLTAAITLVDTPDLDGDQPAHHAQADRAFRWAEALLFLVSPEKYQMTELIPYYRLATRYGIPSLYVMNKCETAAMFDDFARQVGAPVGLPPGGAPNAPAVFAIPRDDAAYEPPPDANLSALRESIKRLQPAQGPTRDQGLANRAGDLVGRLTDQILTPLRADRTLADQLIASLRNLEAPASGVDVNPITEQLNRRLRERSVLYLMSPGKMLDRVRQVPRLVVRLPRTMWDVFGRGQPGKWFDPDIVKPENQEVPDFHAILKNQFSVVQSRIEDAIRANPATERWIAAAENEFVQTRFDPGEAGVIADNEVAELKLWIDKHWDATPRDTAALQRLLKHLPGGKQLIGLSEAAPWLLAAFCGVTHITLVAGDLTTLGLFGGTIGLFERLSNEVFARVRLTNKRIGQRFADLVHRQISQTCDWLDCQAPSQAQMDRLEQLADDLAGTLSMK